ncbi:MAG: hypothetical protein MJ252_10875 [archaeon]|nr:hypothetical protein [archaeon]
MNNQKGKNKSVFGNANPLNPPKDAKGNPFGKGKAKQQGKPVKDPSNPKDDVPQGNPQRGPPKKPFKYDYENIPEGELSTHITLIKKWMIKNNNFNNPNQSLSKLTDLKMDDLNIILNHKTNYSRTKLLIDYLELQLNCPNFAIALRENFVKYSTYLNSIARKILITSGKIKEDSSMFIDFVLLNYPFVINQMSSKEMLNLMQKPSGIVSFSNCTVIKTDNPIFLLWSKKVYPSCRCGQDTKDKPRRYFNIFTKNIKNNRTFSQPIKCEYCNKEYFHESKNDILIECQEIQLIMNTATSNLVQNKFSVWVFGDLIQSVKPGDQINVTAYYARERTTGNEEDFTYGYFIALSFNVCFTPIGMLNATNFILKEGYEQKIPNQGNQRGMMNDGEDQKIQVLNDLQFKKQFNNNFFKFLIQNYIHFQKKQINCFSGFNPNLESLDHQNNLNLAPLYSDNYFPFLNIILDISICQRDYYNHRKKINFLIDNNANYLIEIEKEKFSELNDPNNAKDIFKSQIINQARNLSMKTQVQDVPAHDNDISLLANILNTTINYAKPINSSDDFKKYFRQCKQMSSTNTQNTSDLLKKAFNLFLFFDNTYSDPIYKQLLIYAKSIYRSSLIVIYPFFNQSKKVDKENLWEFLYKCNNKIVLIPDVDALSKGEIDIIKSVMDKNCLQNYSDLSNTNISITFWFCASALKFFETPSNNKKKNNNLLSIPQLNLGVKQPKVKGFEDLIGYCDIVFNYAEWAMKMDSDLEVITLNNFSHYLNDMNTPLLSNENILKMYNKYEKFNTKIKADCSINHYYKPLSDTNPITFDDSYNSAALLEEYFIKKRKIVPITFEDQFNLLRIAMLSSMLRANYENRKFILPSAISNINYFDALLSILIYEEVFAYKYGFEAKSFNNSNTRILFDNYYQDIINTVDSLEELAMASKDHVGQFGIGNNFMFNFADFLQDNSQDQQPKDDKFSLCDLCKEINKIKTGRDYLSDFVSNISIFINGREQGFDF